MLELYKNLPAIPFFSNVNICFLNDKDDYVTTVKGDRMIDDGFDKDDFDSTLARFASKRQKIVHDVSKLKRKKPEPVVFSSATHDFGSAIFNGVANVLTVTSNQRKRNVEWDELKSKEGEDRNNSYFFYK